MRTNSSKVLPLGVLSVLDGSWARLVLDLNLGEEWVGGLREATRRRRHRSMRREIIR